MEKAFGEKGGVCELSHIKKHLMKKACVLSMEKAFAEVLRSMFNCYSSDFRWHFRNEEDRELALKTLDGYKWKGHELKAVVSKGYAILIY